MSTTQKQFENDAIREMLATELADEKRDHAETRRRLDAASSMIEGFERVVKSLAAEIDRKDLLLAKTHKLIAESIRLFDKVSEVINITSTEI